MSDDQSCALISIGRQYVHYINQKYGTSESIWEGPYKASLVQQDKYFLSVMRYTELNPLRAKMMESPAHYRWSSFSHNAGLKMMQEHQIYKGLASDAIARATVCQDLFRLELDDEVMKNINDAWQTGTPLGNE